MKLTAFLLFAVFVSVSARSVSQTITFSGKNVSLETIFSAIEKQTGFVSLYDYHLITESAPISVSVEREPLSSFLSLVLNKEHLDYTISGKNIMVARKIAGSSDRQSVSRIDTVPSKEIDVKGRVTNQQGEALIGERR